MLKTRVLTAIVLLAIVVPALFLLPQSGWAILMMVLASVAGWEWGRFMRLKPAACLVLGGFIAALCAGLLLVNPGMLGIGDRPRLADALPLLLLAAVFWFAVVPLWLRFKWPLGGDMRALAVGILVIVPTWVAIVQLRFPGAMLLLAVMAAVWIADIGAYFFGRLFGRHKLALTISPGKTWEGAIGGGLLVVAYGLGVQYFAGLSTYPLWICVIMLAALAVFSVLGDLFESMLKRQVGLKDSSGVLPGHGGVMDRIDSLTSVLPLAALLLLLMQEFA